MAHFVIWHGEIPPSLNRMGFQSGHWAIAYRKKKQWGDVFAKLLLAAGVPWENRAMTVTVVLHFKDRRRRDVENYRAFISKCFADVLAPPQRSDRARRYIPDDTSDYFRLAVRIGEPDKKKPGMNIELVTHDETFPEMERRGQVVLQ